MGINKVILIGNLGADPEIRYTASNQPVANLRVATNEVWTDRDGKRQERTEWHRVIAWGRLAEVCKEHLAKGRQVYVEGKLQTREWEKDGQRHQTTEVVASHVEFLGGTPGAGRRRDDPPPPQDDDRGGYGGGYGPPPSRPASAPAAPRTNATGAPAAEDDGGW
jgi:single-strand DNA-binding protein